MRPWNTPSWKKTGVSNGRHLELKGSSVSPALNKRGRHLSVDDVVDAHQRVLLVSTLPLQAVLGGTRAVKNRVATWWTKKTSLSPEAVGTDLQLRLWVTRL